MMRVVALLLLARTLAAQSPSERAMLSAWDDSLQHITSRVAIDAYDGPSRRATGRAGEVRRGLFLIRRADLNDSRGDIELALTNMQVLANHTNWPWPWLAMTRAFTVMSRKDWVETLSDGKQLAEKHVDAVWRTLRMALDLDSGFPNARRLLAQLTSAAGDRFLRPDQVTALQREARQQVPYPDALLAWGRHLRTIQEYSHALVTFDRAVALGGDKSRLDLERARTLLALGDTVAANVAYWSGAERISPLGRQGYRLDLWWIAEPEDLTAFDEMPDSAVAPWLHHFWNARDAEAANVSGERLTEHLRRWVIAYQRYRALSPWTDTFWSRVEYKFDQTACQQTDAKMFEQLWRKPRTSEDDLRTNEPLLDHRGMMYLRHGEPVRIITSGGRGGSPLRRRTLRDPYTAAPQAVSPTGELLPWSTRMPGEIPAMSNGPSGESWLYWWDGELHMVNFRGSLALGSYAGTTLTETTPFYLMDNPAIASSLPIKEYYAMAQRTAANDSSPYGPNGPNTPRAIAHRDNPACFNEMRAVAAKTARDENSALTHDSDTPPDFRGHNSVGQMFALGVAADQSSGVLATFAIPGDILNPETLETGQLGYTLAIRIVAYDKALNHTFTVDTIRHFAAGHALEAGEFLTGYTEFGLRAGTWQIATRVRQVSGVTLLQTVQTVRVDDGAAVTLSDIVTGRPGNPVWTATDNAAFPLNYPNGWFSGETAELFFEVRGVPERQSYQTVVEIRPVGGKSVAAIRIQSTDAGTGAVTRVRKTLGLDQLAPGKYTLTVTVEYQGKRASREREILIVKRPGP